MKIEGGNEMKDLPLVTIALPTYNRKNWLKKSLASCLTQTYPNLEIFVCDNASVDGTEEFIQGIKDPRVRHFRQLHFVPALVNWNSCWQYAKGEYLTYLGDDDVVDPEYIMVLVHLALKYPLAALWRCSLRGIDVYDRILWQYNDFPILEAPEDFIAGRVQKSRPSFGSGYLCRTADFRMLNGFQDIGLPGGLYNDDWLWFRMAFQGSAVMSTKKELWSYRVSLQHGAVGINIWTFAEKVPSYIELLVHFLLKNRCSDELIDFVRKDYIVNLIRDRLQLEAGRQRARSLIGYIRRLPEFYWIGKKHKASAGLKYLLKCLLGKV